MFVRVSSGGCIVTEQGHMIIKLTTLIVEEKGGRNIDNRGQYDDVNLLDVPIGAITVPV